MSASRVRLVRPTLLIRGCFRPVVPDDLAAEAVVVRGVAALELTVWVTSDISYQRLSPAFVLACVVYQNITLPAATSAQVMRTLSAVE